MGPFKVGAQKQCNVSRGEVQEQLREALNLVSGYAPLRRLGEKADGTVKKRLGGVNIRILCSK